MLSQFLRNAVMNVVPGIGLAISDSEHSCWLTAGLRIEGSRQRDIHANRLSYFHLFTADTRVLSCMAP